MYSMFFIKFYSKKLFMLYSERLYNLVIFLTGSKSNNAMSKVL